VPEPRHASIHAWVSTVVSVLALLVAGGSAYISWRSDLLKRENISAESSPAGSCRFVLNKWTEDRNKRHNSLIACWAVTIANTSDLRLSIVKAAPGLAPDDLHYKINFVESGDGANLNIPFTLEGGQATSFLVHWYLEIPDRVADIIEEFSDYKLGTLSSFNVYELLKRLRAYRVDLLGNEVDSGGELKGAPWKEETGDFELETGRGTSFTIDVTYPWTTNRVVTIRRLQPF
jgi:hypothetical protein